MSFTFLILQVLHYRRVHYLLTILSNSLQEDLSHLTFAV